MKKGWAFAIISLLVIGLAGGLYYMHESTQNRTLRVAFPSHLPATAYEPVHISLDYEYIFLENVFSPLIEVNARGELEPGVAEKADWVGDELRLTIRDNLKTASGNPITSDDVVFSLKRLLVLSGNTHGNFKDLVCENVELKSIEDNCPGIRQEGRFVYLKTPKHKSFVRPMLAAIDFAIIPKSSVDPKTLKIVNFKETSGPYYVASDDGKGNIHLKLNPYHYHAADNIADNVVLVPAESKIKSDTLQLFSDGKVDLLTTVDAARADELLPFAQSRNDASLHSTMNIRSLILVFTDRGIKKFNYQARYAIGEKVRQSFTEIFKGRAGFEQRNEFFPNQAESSLSAEQQTLLRKKHASITDVKIDKPIKFQFLKRGNIEQWSEPLRKYLPTAECHIDYNLPDLTPNMKSEDVPDAIILATDTGFMEDISLISYSLTAGFLGLDKKDRPQWLADYMAIDDKATRIKKLQDLHFNALAESLTVPLLSSPYTALVRKPWKFELSELYANNQLWLIKTN